MRTDFTNTDDPQKNIMYQNAMNDACSGYCAPETIWVSLLDFFTSILGIFTYGAILLLMSPWILIFLIFSAIIMYFIGRWQRQYAEHHRDEWAALDRKVGYISSFSEKLDYAKDIRLYNMAGWIQTMLAEFQQIRYLWERKKSLRDFFGLCGGSLLSLIRDGITYIILINMMINSQIGIGDFVFYFGTISGFSIWLNGISNKINDIIGKSIRIGYYIEYFNIEEHNNHGLGRKIPMKTEFPVEIQFCNVSYKYTTDEGEIYALKNIDLTIGRGEKLAIVGANGAGKSTLVKLLCGFYLPSEGCIKLNGQDISEYNIEEYYTLFSAVFQDIYLLPVTIAEFVASNDEEINRERVKDVIREAGLEEKIASLTHGIDSRLMKGVFDDSIDMSGGEKQKLMLARALYKDAPVIVLDEPTAAFDPIAENELYQKYNSFTENKTALFISHRLASTRFCDRIIYLENGQIIEEGTHDELMALGGKYTNMFEIQSQYYKENTEELGA